MNSAVLDASALMAVLKRELGAEKVEPILDRSVISAVSLSEIAATLAEAGMPAPEVAAAIRAVNVTVVPFDEPLALAAGRLRPMTRTHGLSLGDRACLALAAMLGVPAVTADHAWQRVDIGVPIHLIR